MQNELRIQFDLKDNTDLEQKIIMLKETLIKAIEQLDNRYNLFKSFDLDQTKQIEFVDSDRNMVYTQGRYRKGQKVFKMKIQEQTIHYFNTRYVLTLPKPLMELPEAQCRGTFRRDKDLLLLVKQ